MERRGHIIQANTLGAACVVAGAVVLAIDPATWLLRSWTDPGYGSYGWAVFALTLVVFARSWSSPLADPVPVPGSPLVLLLGTAAIRAVGQVLDIDTISAVALAVDVYALARLARLDRRSWAVSPVGLAALFLCSLPIQRLVQRSFGQGLQNLSADGACGVLTYVFGDVQCSGVQITLAGTPVMVDLPCAGAGGLTLLATGLILVACRTRPGILRMSFAAIVALVASLAANILRISVLTVGAAYGGGTGVDLLAEPWHSMIGLVTLAIAALPALAMLTNAAPARAKTAIAARHIPLPAAIVFAALALGVLFLPSKPLDARGPRLEVTLPMHLAGIPANHLPLSSIEAHYYAAYGGGAAKATYGPMGLLVSRTNAPLRHLHDAQDCLKGLGFDVRVLGTQLEPAPATVLHLTDPEGRTWVAHASFVSDTGLVVPTVSAAIWQWFRDPGTTWTAVQRITPTDTPDFEREALDAAVRAAFDLS